MTNVKFARFLEVGDVKLFRFSTESTSCNSLPFSNVQYIDDFQPNSGSFVHQMSFFVVEFSHLPILKQTRLVRKRNLMR